MYHSILPLSQHRTPHHCFSCCQLTVQVVLRYCLHQCTQYRCLGVWCVRLSVDQDILWIFIPSTQHHVAKHFAKITISGNTTPHTFQLYTTAHTKHILFIITSGSWSNCGQITAVSLILGYCLDARGWQSLVSWTRRGRCFSKCPKARLILDIVKGHLKQSDFITPDEVNQLQWRRVVWECCNLSGHCGVPSLPYKVHNIKWC